MKREHAVKTSPDSTIYFVDADAVLHDAVVIRTQDVFAYSGLAAYANTIRNTIALLELTVGPLEEPVPLIKRLGGVADYFEACAQEAEDRIANGEVKVPD